MACPFCFEFFFFTYFCVEFPIVVLNQSIVKSLSVVNFQLLSLIWLEGSGHNMIRATLESP